MSCWKGNGKGGWERRWEGVSNGKHRRCRKGRGRGVVNKGRGREIVRERGRRRENWRVKERGGRGEGDGGKRGGKEKLDCAFLINVWYNV